MKQLSIFLIAVALVVGLAGCNGESYALAISSTEGGSVTTPGEGMFTYDEGTVIGLVAEAADDYYFVDWTGDVATVDNVNSPITTITIQDNYAISANFEQIPPGQFVLTIYSTAGGSVMTPGEGTFTYDEGTIVSLVANRDSGYRFVNWTGDVSTITDVNTATTNITMNGSYSITANFVEIPVVQYQLAINSTEGGLVTTPGEGVFIYAEGTVVNLVAEADEAYQFIDWTGDVSTVADINSTVTNITIFSSYNITANFLYSILLAANLEVEQVIAASLEYYADFGVWPRDTTDTSGNISFMDYITGTLGASYSFGSNGFIDGVSDPGGTGGGTTSSEYDGIHWENPTPPTVGHGQWVSDY